MHYCTFASQYGSVLYSFSQKLDFFFLFRKKLSNLLFPTVFRATSLALSFHSRPLLLFHLSNRLALSFSEKAVVS